MSAFDTPLTRLTGIDFPIVQSPLGSATTPELVAATCNAGILGFHNITWKDPDEIPGFLQRTRDLTSRPFGVNFILHWDPAERLAIALDAGITFISFFWGDASQWIPQCHAAGAKVFVTAGSVEEAKAAVAAGADFIVAQGWEAGGHVRGETSTMVLTPLVVDAVAPVPVLAAGGIGDGRGIAAALALGAAGVWMGTRFLFAAENRFHPAYIDALLTATTDDTVHTDIFDIGWPNAPVRVIRNSTWRNWQQKHGGDLSSRPDSGQVIAWRENGEPLMRYSDDIPSIGITGQAEALAMYAGQSVGLHTTIQPAQEIVGQLVRETFAAQAHLNQVVPA